MAYAGAAIAADDWQAGAGPEWQKVLAAAKNEGKVVVAGPAPLSKPLSAGFEKDTGISVEFVTGSIGDMATRFEREAKAGTMTADVIIGGGIEMFTMYLPGYLDPIKPRLMLPGTTRGADWMGGKIKWFDNQAAYMPLISNWVHGWAVVNSEKVDVAQIKTWQDLLKPEYKGKIASYDPRLGGPGQSAIAYLAHQFGIEYVKKLFIGQEVTYTRDSRQVVEWAARGTYPIVLGAIQFEVERFRRGGMRNLVVPTLSDGPGTLTGGFGVVKLPKGVPHPNAATVFLNWLMSKPGHIAYASTMLETSTRVDAQLGEVPDYVNPKAGAVYLDQYDEDWYKNERPKLAKALVEALGGR
ncbi:MAG: extracellular solute-binding protein [Alphaproteobacteria bacterium]|nr:extracellular solute-binding protein [Alphaproteobacteria bacterium]